jgi:hypothetical protein
MNFHRNSSKIIENYRKYQSNKSDIHQNSTKNQLHLIYFKKFIYSFEKYRKN